MQKIRQIPSHLLDYLKENGKWILMGICVGAICGVVGAYFHHALTWAAKMRRLQPQLLWALPVLGCAIIFLYHFMGMPSDRGTNRVLDAARSNEHIPLKVGAAVSVATVLTQLGGGSAGREGAALQIGGSIGSAFSRWFRKLLKLDGGHQKVGVVCGMAGLFSALFGTPVGAAIFSIEVCECPGVQHIYLLPTMMASVVARLVALELGGKGETLYVITSTQVAPMLVGKTIVLSVLCALVSILFCSVIHAGHHIYKKISKNPYINVVLGGLIVIAARYMLGTEFLGAGMNIAEEAIAGRAEWYTFLVKMLLTSVTLGAGFKGGEIVPSFAVGASFGCVVAPLLGIDATLGAALGMIFVFCGVVNCPMASMVLSLELFGTSRFLLLFAIGCAVSMIFSGSCSLYSSQRLLKNKLLPLEENEELKNRLPFEISGLE